MPARSFKVGDRVVASINATKGLVGFLGENIATVTRYATVNSRNYGYTLELPSGQAFKGVKPNELVSAERLLNPATRVQILSERRSELEAEMEDIRLEMDLIFHYPHARFTASFIRSYRALELHIEDETKRITIAASLSGIDLTVPQPITEAPEAEVSPSFHRDPATTDMFSQTQSFDSEEGGVAVEA